MIHEIGKTAKIQCNPTNSNKSTMAHVQLFKKLICKLFGNYYDTINHVMAAEIVHSILHVQFARKRNNDQNKNREKKTRLFFFSWMKVWENTRTLSTWISCKKGTWQPNYSYLYVIKSVQSSHS